MPIIELTLSQAAATRLQAALKESLDPRDEDGEPRVVTLADAKDYIVQDLKQLIRSSENRVAVKAAREAASADPAIG